MIIFDDMFIRIEYTSPNIRYISIRMKRTIPRQFFYITEQIRAR